jgi:hypothetical protein
VLAVTAHPRVVELQQQDVRTLQPAVEGMELPSGGTIATLVLGVREVALRDDTVRKQRADLQGQIRKVCRNSRPTTAIA